MRIRGDSIAFGGPGIAPTWARADKDGVGTSYSADSRIWFTLRRGILTEVYYPLIDHPQTRDLEYLITDGSGFLHEEKRHLEPKVERLSEHSLGYHVRSTDPEGRYRIDKEVISHPHLPCVLLRTHFRPARSEKVPLRMFALLAPHLDVRGWGNNGYVVDLLDRSILAAERNGTWLALGADVPFARLSAGYVGSSDGWTDLTQNYEMDWTFDRAPSGNIALTGEIDLARSTNFTLALAFGQGLESAVSTLMQALGTPFADLRRKFQAQWERAWRRLPPLAHGTGDRGNLYYSSHSLILAHEDKTFPGAFIASLSIPWGNAKGDDDRGGYHLVWTRDMVTSATGLLAAGNSETPLRALIYLAAAQQPDGGFPQNFWLNGEPYWKGVQLDEVSFPILLAHRLHQQHALQNFDPYPMVMGAARFLLEHGPATQQERWEELAGYSPSTLAVHISALVLAASFAEQRGDSPTSKFLLEHADFLESHIETWTVTTSGTLDPEIPRHYIRIRPVRLDDPQPDEDPNHGTVRLPNLPPGEPADFPAKEIIDPGFLELVRYGIRRPDDPAIIDSLRLVDRLLKVDTPHGPVWRRYNHDGYGQRPDGGPYVRWGTGRAWPLLTGERGHYALAAGEDAAPYLRTLERIATSTGLLPEQVWDTRDQPTPYLEFGRPTGAAMPLVWAHAEYLKLLRSEADRAIFDRIPAVEERYARPHARRPRIEIWKMGRRPVFAHSGGTLRVEGTEPFRLHWSRDGWHVTNDTDSIRNVLGIEYVDVPLDGEERGEVTFTFYWKNRDSWEGRDYSVTIVPEESIAPRLVP